MAASRAQTSATEIVLHSFRSTPPKGAFPNAGLSADPAGSLYGTTVYGGESNAGVVFKLDSARNYTVLHSFTGGLDGANPFAGVILDSAGNLYGTAAGGGSTNNGVVYKLDPSGVETVLYSFAGGSDGSEPYAGVVRDAAGNLYGTTFFGGAADVGVVFKLDASGRETVLHSFSRGKGASGTDGWEPYAGVTLDSAGNLYGTTTESGVAGAGIIYKLDPAANETVLHNFTNTDGAQPRSAPILDSSGNLYGTTRWGGQWNQGVVYKLDTAGHETVLHAFTRAAGGQPYAGVTFDSSGNLYGTATSGGAAGWGAVYKLDPTGQETVLHSFTDGADGVFPYGGVMRDPAGGLYGTASGGGTPGEGVVFGLDASGQETILYTFTGNPDGQEPKSGVTLDAAGSLYGTTYTGGLDNSGIVYKLDTAGHETALYTFQGGTDGGNPLSGVTLDSEGNLYGTAYGGGPAGDGVVYKLDSAGHQTVLHGFTGPPDGASPVAGVVRDSTGNLYGTTRYGGTYDAGTVYKVDAASQETVLYSFTGLTDGSNPDAGVILDSLGNLYGTTFGGGLGGVVYKLDMAGNETVLHGFEGTDGSLPYAGVIRDPAGNLYGTTTSSYPAVAGVVYKLDSAGNETILYNFESSGDSYNGGAPYGGVVRDPKGGLYGTTLGGGSSNSGVVYMLDAAGRETVLYSFTGSSDGGKPYAGVTRDPAGNLYGTASTGGQYGGGVVFKVVR
jgi:uncharacterized repeat protein (TIGR03803 family)